jgi:hypothetical protein
MVGHRRRRDRPPPVRPDQRLERLTQPHERQPHGRRKPIIRRHRVSIVDVRDVGAASTWLAEAFGFKAQVIDEASAIVRSGSGTVLIQTERPGDLHGSHTGRGWVYVVIDDIDAHYARAKSADASLLGEPHDYGGYRGYSARDLEGNLAPSRPGAG